MKILSIFIVALTITNAFGGSKDKEDGQLVNNDFSFFVFAQLWPITSCDIWESRDEANTCFLPRESKLYNLLHMSQLFNNYRLNTIVKFNELYVCNKYILKQSL